MSAFLLILLISFAAFVLIFYHCVHAAYTFLRQLLPSFQKCFISNDVFFPLYILFICVLFTFESVFPQAFSLLDSVRIVNQNTAYCQLPFHCPKMNFLTLPQPHCELIMGPSANFGFTPVTAPCCKANPLPLHSCDIDELRLQCFCVGAWSAFEMNVTGVGKNQRIDFVEMDEGRRFVVGKENLVEILEKLEDEGVTELPSWSECVKLLKKAKKPVSGGDVIAYVEMYCHKQKYPRSVMGRCGVNFTSLALGMHLARGGMTISKTMSFPDAWRCLDAYFGSGKELVIPTQCFTKKMPLILKSLRMLNIYSYFPSRFPHLFSNSAKFSNASNLSPTSTGSSPFNAVMLAVLQNAQLRTTNKPIQELERKYARPGRVNFDETLPLTSINAAILSTSSVAKRREIVTACGVQLAPETPCNSKLFASSVVGVLCNEKVMVDYGKLTNPRTRRKQHRVAFKKYSAHETGPAAVRAREFIRKLGITPESYFASLS